jgi:hypothetical protein
LTYETFGRLFVICPTDKDRWGKYKWWCHCECGKFIELVGTSLTKGNTMSCGCIRDELISKVNLSHGESNGRFRPLYEPWKNMRVRCNCTNYRCRDRYGGRGISICNEWDSFDIFKVWAILHGWHKGLTLDRIDVDGNYSPDNCEWVTAQENCRRRWHAS